MKHSNAESCADVVWQVWIARFQFFLWQIFRHQHPYSDQIWSWQIPVAWQIVPADRICTVTAQLSDNCWLEHLEGDKVLRIMTALRAISLPHLMNFLAKGSLCSNWNHGFRSDCIKVLLAKQSSHVYISFRNWRFAMPWSQMQVSTRSDPTQVLPATFEFGYLVCGLACSWLLVCVMLLFRTAGYCRARQIQSAFDCC